MSTGTVGWSLPGYALLEVLGRGGFATVYRAHQYSLGREVAVKVLKADLTTDSDRLRFERERQALVALSDHPCVVDVFDAGLTAEQHPYLVMRLHLRGSLSQKATGHGLPLPEVIDAISRIGSALTAAHALGMLHRDIKPANVLLDADGQAVLSDFGIAAILETGGGHTTTTTFTAPYTAPEVMTGGDATVASEVYSLAATTYHLLAGRPPFATNNPVAIVINEPEPLLGVPPAVAAVVTGGMSKDPAARPASVVAFVTALRHAAGVPPATTYPLSVTELPTARATPGDPPPGAPGRELRLRRAVLTVLGLGLAGTVGAVLTAQLGAARPSGAGPGPTITRTTTATGPGRVTTTVRRSVGPTGTVTTTATTGPTTITATSPVTTTQTTTAVSTVVTTARTTVTVTSPPPS